jgi:hypothetical protein
VGQSDRFLRFRLRLLEMIVVCRMRGTRGHHHDKNLRKKFMMWKRPDAEWQKKFKKLFSFKGTLAVFAIADLHGLMSAVSLFKFH